MAEGTISAGSGQHYDFERPPLPTVPRISEIRFAVRENRPSNTEVIAVIAELVDWLFDNSTIWVWEDRAIQGFSAADPRDGSICALFVHPSYEGRGIGRALLPLACDMLKASGHGMAVLTTAAGTRAERSIALTAGPRSAAKRMARSSFKRTSRHNRR